MNPVYHQSRFLLSAAKLSQAPCDQGKEVAFAGRSNAGKSSAINILTQQNGLARVSKTPGRTQLLNFFEFSDQYRIVDLPGYGYAKVPGFVKDQWHQMMENYLQNRQSLSAIVLVMDIRHPLQAFDFKMVEWCQYTQLPLHIMLTKADKLKYGAAKNTLLSVQRRLVESQLDVSLQLFSALKKMGIDEIHHKLDQWFYHD